MNFAGGSLAQPGALMHIRRPWSSSCQVQRITTSAFRLGSLCGRMYIYIYVYIYMYIYMCLYVYIYICSRHIFPFIVILIGKVGVSWVPRLPVARDMTLAGLLVFASDPYQQLCLMPNPCTGCSACCRAHVSHRRVSRLPDKQCLETG